MSKYLRRHRKREVLSGHYYTYESPVPSPFLPYNREKASRQIVTTRDNCHSTLWYLGTSVSLESGLRSFCPGILVARYLAVDSLLQGKILAWIKANSAVL